VAAAAAAASGGGSSTRRCVRERMPDLRVRERMPDLLQILHIACAALHACPKASHNR
jgi:hypothetical protein